MTEDDARGWIRNRYGVSRETILARLVDLLRNEAALQNLVSLKTLDQLWSRHIVDSAQLLDLAGERTGDWVDIGTGAGFPGLVIAILRQRPIVLTEPRKRRAEFLQTVVAALDLGGHTRVAPIKVQALRAKAAIISARAVAALPMLFAAAGHLSDSRTLWLLPKGRGAAEEVAAAQKTWQGTFHVEQSLTHPDSLIVVAHGIART